LKVTSVDAGGAALRVGSRTIRTRTVELPPTAVKGLRARRKGAVLTITFTATSRKATLLVERRRAAAVTKNPRTQPGRRASVRVKVNRPTRVTVAAVGADGRTSKPVSVRVR
jgi:hypothetical protein